jgi:predicted metalloprotease with PDZ domain
VRSFRALDAHGAEIPTTQLTTNDWLISAPATLSVLKYAIEDSFDAEVDEHVIFPMSGTGIEPEYVIINTFGVLGYFADRQYAPVRLNLRFNEDWEVGTALERDADGRYVADSYYHLADSPILLGELTTAHRRVGDVDVQAYVYSPSEEINADHVMTRAEDVLSSAYDFIGFAPVDRYVFLMYFFDNETAARNPAFVAAGALEHSYSSTYALPAEVDLLPIVTDGMAHEFMHVLTPLHLRSEIIAAFDYSRPTSEDHHLWLYEGVTEWAADIMQLRAGMIDVDQYLRRISDKITTSEDYGSDWSLTRLSWEWFTDEGRSKYGDIYQLGALTAICLDIRLLQLSGGMRGLREVYLGLVAKYGKDRPFDNGSFLDESVAVTHPEIRSFIDDHIRGRQPLDYEYYFDLVGIRYVESRPSASPTPLFGLAFGERSDGRLEIAGFSRDQKDFGLREGDIVLALLDTEVTAASADSVFALRESMRPGDTYRIRVMRAGEELEFEGRLIERLDHHVFEVDEESSEEQKRLRNIWMRNPGPEGF